MTIFRSKGAREPSPPLARTLESLAERNKELKRRQDKLEQRIRELAAMRAALFPQKK
jgi:prefoldin subunit 5